MRPPAVLSGVPNNLAYSTGEAFHAISNPSGMHAQFHTGDEHRCSVLTLSHQSELDWKARLRCNERRVVSDSDRLLERPHVLAPLAATIFKKRTGAPQHSETGRPPQSARTQEHAAVQAHDSSQRACSMSAPSSPMSEIQAAQSANLGSRRFPVKNIPSQHSDQTSALTARTRRWEHRYEAFKSARVPVQ